MYDWVAEFDLAGACGILEDMARIIGRPPDIATLADSKGGKDYKYKVFKSRNSLARRGGQLIAYTWRRNETLSDFAIELACVPSGMRCLSIHLDQNSVEDISKVITQILDYVVGRIHPTYGIGYDMPYFWGPRTYAKGMRVSFWAYEDRTFYGPPDIVNRQADAFSGTYITHHSRRGLDRKLRDVFPLNLISAGHLTATIENMSLHDWIAARKAGTLRQLNATAWRWDVPDADAPWIRNKLIAAGLTIVKE